MRKEEEIQRALAAYKTAVEYADARKAGGNTATKMQDDPKIPTHPPNPVSHRGPHPNVRLRESITEYYDFEITQLIEWIESDGRLRTDEEIIEELLPELGFSRRGARIEAVLRYLLDHLRNKARRSS